ncbi:MAG: hypothetical protein BM564_10725, partial [Bacteroidetes bacterium MedPE-SWsnd-G2]
MTNGNFVQCSGVFYDSGGEFGPYGNDENFVITICPENPGLGEFIILDFTVFSTQLNVDYMVIYDGDDTSAPSFGTYSGGNNPGMVQASSTSGCLTVEFVTNGSGTTTGWAADILCVTPCQDIIANIDSTIPAMDGSNTVIADLNEVITFNGSGTFSVGDNGATYDWDFGDGTTGTGATTTHAYGTAGLYPVTLVVTDTNPLGCSSTNIINLTAQVGASYPGNPYVDAGDDVSVNCSGECVDIEAGFLDIGETNTYRVDEIVFVPPFPFDGLSNSMNTNSDDLWSDVGNLPFDFCFFTQIETLFQVGSNGLIRFDVDASDNGNAWAFTESLPNNSNPSLGEGNVFTPVHDINPAAGNAEEIAWEIIGTAPNRVLAVSFYNVPMFSCTTMLASHMAVFYETTNVIDIYIKDKPTCTTWNSGNAAVGIQNDAGTTAFVPPGRNTGQWTATDEAWRFTPDGPSVVDFTWLDPDGNVVGTDPVLTVCPTQTTDYTAVVNYTNCNGDVVTVTDDVTVEYIPPFDVQLEEDIDLCVGGEDVNLDVDINSDTAIYQWSLDGVEMVGETNPTLTVSTPNSGTYSVLVNDQGCDVIDDIIITYHDIPVIQNIDLYRLCDDVVLDDFTDFDLSIKDTEITNGQADVTLTYHLSQDDADNNANPIDTTVPFTNTVNPQLVYVRLGNTLNPNCYASSTFEILVDSGIVLEQPEDMVDCDRTGDDGAELFNLDIQTPIIMGVQDPAEFTLTYHTSQADAETNSNAIVAPYENISNPQTIWARVENNVNTLCFEYISFDLIVNPLPTIFAPTALEVCYDITDDITDFTLSDKTSEILGGQTNINVSFHETQLDAEDNLSPLAEPYNIP